MKAIETHYKGYRFRSRLEARWAVYFDALDYVWEYEPEGFVLTDGTKYLPDFKIEITDTNCDHWVFWFEVKPEGGSSKKAEKFAEDLDASGSRDIVILLDGTPERLKRYSDLGFGQGWWLAGCRRRPWHDDDGNWTLEDALSYGKVFDDNFAVQAARSARFEFGESGARV